MAIDSNSYSSVDDVYAMTRHVLSGETTFDTSTVPTLAEVESFIDDVSSLLNDAVASFGFTVPISTAGPLRSCDLWVRLKAAALVELTQRGSGFDESESSRVNMLVRFFDEAFNFVKMRAEGWKNQGVTVSDAMYQGLTFTAFDKHSERTDKDSTTLEQPKFRRGLFDA